MKTMTSALMLGVLPAVASAIIKHASFFYSHHMMRRHASDTYVR
jgi:hypothetical protein